MSDGLSEIAKRNKRLSEAKVENVDTSATPSRDAIEVLKSPPTLSRPSWPETWMTVAREIAKRSYDPRLRVGCVVVPEDNTGILALGYNGNARGLPNEAESLEPGQSGMIHAEQNALVKCPFHYPVAKHIYSTHSMCRQCAKLVINAGIKRVVYGELYRDPSGLDLLRQAGVQVYTVEEASAIRVGL